MFDCHSNADILLDSQVTSHFVNLVLSCVAPPFSDDFAKQLQQFLAFSTVKSVVAADANLRCVAVPTPRCCTMFCVSGHRL